MQNYIFCQHLTKSTLLEEHSCKQIKTVDVIVFCIGPRESKFIPLIGIICKIPRIHTVRNNEYLYVVK